METKDSNANGVEISNMWQENGVIMAKQKKEITTKNIANKNTQLPEKQKWKISVKQNNKHTRELILWQMLKQNSCSTEEQDQLIAMEEDPAKRRNGRINDIKIPIDQNSMTGQWITWAMRQKTS